MPRTGPLLARADRLLFVTRFFNWTFFAPRIRGMKVAEYVVASGSNNGLQPSSDGLQPSSYVVASDSDLFLTQTIRFLPVAAQESPRRRSGDSRVQTAGFGRVADLVAKLDSLKGETG